MILNHIKRNMLCAQMLHTECDGMDRDAVAIAVAVAVTVAIHAKTYHDIVTGNEIKHFFHAIFFFCFVDQRLKNHNKNLVKSMQYVHFVTHMLPSSLWILDIRIGHEYMLAYVCMCI